MLKVVSSLRLKLIFFLFNFFLFLGSFCNYELSVKYEENKINVSLKHEFNLIKKLTLSVNDLGVFEKKSLENVEFVVDPKGSEYAKFVFDNDTNNLKIHFL